MCDSYRFSCFINNYLESTLFDVGHLIATRLRIPHSKLPAVFAHLGAIYFFLIVNTKLYKIYIYPGQINMSTLTFIVILIV